MNVVIQNYKRETPDEEDLYRFMEATESFQNNTAMIRILKGDKIDKDMASSMFKYIWPDKDKMDKKSFELFVNHFGLNTYNVSTDVLFDAISGKRPSISVNDLYTFIAGKLTILNYLVASRKFMNIICNLCPQQLRVFFNL